MIERVFPGGTAHPFGAPGPERPARRGQHDLRNDIGIGNAPGMRQTLHDGAVLGVDRDNRNAALARPVHHQSSGADERFLVRKGDGRTAPDGGQCRGQPGRTDNRGHHHIGFEFRRFVHGRRAGAAPDARTSKRVNQIGCPPGIADGREFRIVQPSQFGQPVHIAMRGDGLDPEDVGMAADKVERAGANRSRCPQDAHAAGTGGGRRGSIFSPRRQHAGPTFERAPARVTAIASGAGQTTRRRTNDPGMPMVEHADGAAQATKHICRPRSPLP